MVFNFNNKQFKSINKSNTGEVGQDTIFTYQQDGNIVTGQYSGGQILSGQLVAKVLENGHLQMRYQHLNTNGQFKYGHCHSTPEVMPNGKIRLHEKWQWDCDDLSTGESIIEEI